MFAALTMATALDRAARLYPDRPAVLDTAGDLTWAGFRERIARTASVLWELGLRAGERFGVVGQNSALQAELLNGGYWLGAVPVPVNYRLAPPEIDYILADAGCRVVFVDERFIGLADAPALSRWREKTVALAPAGTSGAYPQYARLFAAAAPRAMHRAAPEDDAILLYTGGTTGRAKGVPLTHANTVANGLQIALAIRAGAGDRFLHVLPMFHSADLFGTAITLVGGAHAYLDQFSPDGMLAAIAAHRITTLCLGPTLMMRTLLEGDFNRHDCASVRRLFYGSAPMAIEWIERTMARFPSADLQQSYGLTEAAPFLTCCAPEQHREAIATGRHDLLRSVGKPLVGVDLRIVNDRGDEQPAGAIGEVVVRGPNVTKGYLGLPHQDAAAFRDGWFHTGDAGYVDERCNLFLKDRIKDMIITGGENVYCSEVEEALYKHPAVSEVAVVGIADEKWGEAVFAVIVPVRGEVLTEKDVIEHCRAHIGGYKIPRRMAFVDALPKSAMGKVLKGELRRTYG